jgi:hypothetical protein
MMNGVIEEKSNRVVEVVVSPPASRLRASSRGRGRPHAFLVWSACPRDQCVRGGGGEPAGRCPS